MSKIGGILNKQSFQKSKSLSLEKDIYLECGIKQINYVKCLKFKEKLMPANGFLSIFLLKKENVTGPRP